jgi:hypothetical protein
MLKNCVRILSVIFSFSSTASAAQSLDDIFSALKEVDTQVADLGFEADKEKYSFGAKKELDDDISFNMGIGGRINNTQDYNLSNSYRGIDSQTNRIEEGYDPRDATPMLGFSIGHKF